MSTTRYKVTWDNGASACGTFPYVFDTYQEADDYGREWADESNLRDFGTTEPEDGYSYDVIETTDVDDVFPRVTTPDEEG